MKILYNKYDKKEVVEKYLDIIIDSCKMNGIDVIKVYSLDELDKGDYVITTNVDDAFKAIILKNANVVNWYQGLRPEESFIRNGSKLRKILLNYVEKTVLNKSKMNIFVSEGMKKFYEKKYNYKNKNNFIMPCFNTTMNEDYLKIKRKDTYCYVGGLSKWQCFEQTVKIYKEIENKNKRSKLYVFTPDIDKAVKILNNHNVNNFDVKFVKNEELKNELKYIQYGFVLREDNPINYVSTPTKISTYLANSIIPITTNAINDNKIIFKNTNNVVMVSLDQNVDDISEAIINSNNNDSSNIYKEFSQIFDDYYNIDKYKLKLKKILSNI